MKNRMIAWVSGVILVVVTLMVIIVKMEPPRDGIIRAQAMKAMALALTDKEECEKRAEERGTSHFSAKEKDNWFVKYMDYLYDEGYLDPELTPASLAAATQFPELPLVLNAHNMSPGLPKAASCREKISLKP